MLNSGRAKRACLEPKMENQMTNIKDMKRELTTLKAERAMLIRRGDATAGIDAKIASIKEEIASTGATVAEVYTAGQFATDQPVSHKELLSRDMHVMGEISSNGGIGAYRAPVWIK